MKNYTRCKQKKKETIKHWKNRKSLQEELLKTYNELSSGIESIIQDSMVAEIPLESLGGE